MYLEHVNPIGSSKIPAGAYGVAGGARGGNESGEAESESN